MPIATRGAFSVGLDALRANPLRTLLSTLGVVMGVGAMVSVLSMSDGVERFTRDQIAQTTDLLGVTISPTTSRNVDGQSIRRDDVIRFNSADVASLRDSVPGWDKVALISSGAALVALDSLPPRGFALMGVLASHFADAEMTFTAGAAFADGDSAVVVLGERAAGVVARDSAAPARALGREVRLGDRPYRVVGVVRGGRQGTAALTAFVPVARSEQAMPGSRPPSITLVARRIEEVDSIRVASERWLAARYGPEWKGRASVQTNQARVAQVASAMLVFKILMGAITGVSLLVGGIGIMNVLLAAVAERTREIGIRKAMGARNSDILVQFLGESVAITSAGAAVGVALGLGISFLTAWIMRTQTKAPVHAAVTPGTILVAAGASVLIGLVFGLYPALRAARLSPIDAIRHE